MPPQLPKILRSSFNIVLLVFLVSTAFGQKKNTPADSLKKSYVPTGIRVGTDLISIVKTQATSKFKGWEMNVDTDLLRYHVALDYGQWSRSLNIKEGDYHNSGNYYRIGTDVNFLLKDPDRNLFFLGFRYGWTKFDEALNFQYEDPTFGTVTNQLNNTGLKARWAELTTGIRVKIWKELWMGYTARMKFAHSVTGARAFDTYDIPGYGVTDKKIYWGFNYQVFWRFAWKKNLGAIRPAK